MALPVLVLHQIPAFRGGIAQALDPKLHHYKPSNSLDWDDWLARSERRCVIICVDRPDAWDRLSQAVGVPQVTTIAVAPEPDARLYLRALRWGADGATDCFQRPRQIVRAMEAALDGHILLPVEVCRTLAAARFDPELSDEDLAILQALSQGRTAHDIALGIPVSTRTGRRYVHKICEKLGAASAGEAVAIAKRMGLIE